MPPLDTIVIKAPPGTKARWVHQAQSGGRKLSDWVCMMIDEPADPDRWLSRFARHESGSVVMLAEPELRAMLRRAYLAGAARA